MFFSPGPIETPIFDRVNASTELLDSIRTADPLGRFGQCSEMSKCMLFLCSDEASYVTGATLVADGGLSLVK
jgi:NAD(P)-dependent dehydrogenase (short-subunit alcohol dehydrogenase family)